MSDVHTIEVRSYNMSRIKSKNTKPELLLRKYLFKLGYRYRIHNVNLAGKPDLVFKKFKTVIFVNGCFWHGHENCRFFILPKTRAEWWTAKINKTKDNDLKNKQILLENGWKVITVFECELKPKLFDSTISRIVNELH